jgi:hypothetical protein
MQLRLFFPAIWLAGCLTEQDPASHGEYRFQDLNGRVEFPADSGKPDEEIPSQAKAAERMGFPIHPRVARIFRSDTGFSIQVDSASDSPLPQGMFPIFVKCLPQSALLLCPMPANPTYVGPDPAPNPLLGIDTLRIQADGKGYRIPYFVVAAGGEVRFLGYQGFERQADSLRAWGRVEYFRLNLIYR